MTDGSEFTTRTTWGKEGDVMHLDIDPKSHPAWTGGQQHLLDRGGRLSAVPEEVFGLPQGRRENNAAGFAPETKTPASRGGFVYSLTVAIRCSRRRSLLSIEGLQDIMVRRTVGHYFPQAAPAGKSRGCLSRADQFFNLR